MKSLTHVTLNTGHTRQSPRSEVGDDIVAQLGPVLRAGQGELSGLYVNVESRTGPATVFTLGWAADVPAVICWLAADAWPAAWRTAGGEGREPAAPWLAVQLLPGAADCTPEQLLMLDDVERRVAWALLES